MVGGDGDPIPMCEQGIADPITDRGSMEGGEIPPPNTHTHTCLRQLEELAMGS